MIIVALIMLLAPGFIALRIHWRGKKVVGADKKIASSTVLYMLWDYFIYTFLIALLGYVVMFLMNPQRLVSFSSNFSEVFNGEEYIIDSTIFSAGFVVKYSVVALILAVILPYVLKKAVKILFKK